MGYFDSFRDELEALAHDIKSESMTTGGRHRKTRHRKTGPVYHMENFHGKNSFHSSNHVLSFPNILPLLQGHPISQSPTLHYNYNSLHSDSKISSLSISKNDQISKYKYKR